MKFKVGSDTVNNDAFANVCFDGAVARMGKVWGKGIYQNVVWYVVKTCCERAGLEHIAPHDLRRYAASRIMPNARAMAAGELFFARVIWHSPAPAEHRNIELATIRFAQAHLAVTFVIDQKTRLGAPTAWGRQGSSPKNKKGC